MSFIRAIKLFFNARKELFEKESICDYFLELAFFYESGLCVEK